MRTKKFYWNEFKVVFDFKIDCKWTRVLENRINKLKMHLIFNCLFGLNRYSKLYRFKGLISYRLWKQYINWNKVYSINNLLINANSKQSEVDKYLSSSLFFD